MEIIVGLVIFYIFFWVIGFIFEKIKEWNEERKKEIEDNVAHDLLNDDFINNLNDYKNKLEKIAYFKKSGSIDCSTKKEANFFQSHINVLFNTCPKCNNGKMIERKGKFGKFYGCSNFPACKYTKNFKELDLEYKTSVKENFLEDFKKAYK